jgi:hypothetical protein
MKLFLLLTLLAASCALADVATQTDWSGGPGVSGPLTVWGNAFSDCYGIVWDDAPGQASPAPFVEHIVEDLADNSTRLCSADLDGDMDMDLIGVKWYSTSWWENADGMGGEWIEHPVAGAGGNPVSLDDMDGDGDVDILYSTDYTVVWLENADGSGTSWIVNYVSTSMSRSVAPASADIDGDGDEDVVCANFEPYDGTIYWWENSNGSGTVWVPHSFVAAAHGYNSVATDDVDGDGDSDVLAAAVYDSDMIWIENLDGQGSSWLEVTIDSDFDSALLVYSADIDGDGDEDVLGGGGSGSGGAGISWWENMDGSGTSWQKQFLMLGLDFRGILDTADLDGDGDEDVAANTWFPGAFYWLENSDGQGTAWEAHLLKEYASYSDASWICASDIDGDGRLDAAGSSWMEDEVYWWDILPTASLTSSILYTGNDPDWGMLLWSAATPPGTSAGIQVRASDDPASMGVWSDTLWAPGGLHGILMDNTSYFQYRAVLAATDPDSAPVLNEVSVTWTSLGTGGGDTPASFTLLPVSPNPSAGAPIVEFGLAVAGSVEISVFDIAGRMVRSIAPSENQAGWHSIQLGELSPGVYFVRLRVGDSEGTQRFVTVE